MTDRVQRRADLRADVELMRELGVARWGAVFLGPPPLRHVEAFEPTPEQARLIESERAQRRHDTLFAATSVKPRMRAAADQQADENNARLERVAGAKK